MTNTQLYLSIGIPTLAIVLTYLSILSELAKVKAHVGDIVSQLGRLEDKFDIVLRH